MIQLQIISECCMYFLQFFKNYEIPKNVTDKITKFSENVYIVTHGSSDILRYQYEIFMWNLCEIYMFMQVVDALY